jgi:ribosomal protein S18 acetylase RimI-like enzyme
MTMITIRELLPEELNLSQDIDISESGKFIYTFADGELQRQKLEWKRPNWNAVEWTREIGKWKDVLCWDVAVGAFDGKKLIGLASMRFRLTEHTAQLVSLHVDREYRRQGIATQLTREIIRLARESGAHKLYVSSTPSESAVGFYLSQGFQPTNEVNQELFDLEPEDIHMIKNL